MLGHFTRAMKIRKVPFYCGVCFAALWIYLFFADPGDDTPVIRWFWMHGFDYDGALLIDRALHWVAFLGAAGLIGFSLTKKTASRSVDE